MCRIHRTANKKVNMRSLLEQELRNSCRTILLSFPARMQLGAIEIFGSVFQHPGDRYYAFRRKIHAL